MGLIKEFFVEFLESEKARPFLDKVVSFKHILII